MSEQIKKIKTGKKDGQLLIRIQSTERDEFIRLCEELDTSVFKKIGFCKQHKTNKGVPVQEIKKMRQIEVAVKNRNKPT